MSTGKFGMQCKHKHVRKLFRKLGEAKKLYFRSKKQSNYRNYLWELKHGY